MLSLEQVKKILHNPAIPDEELLEIRDQFHSLAEIIFEQWQKEQQKERLKDIVHQKADYQTVDQ